ncbi:hypothetical protein HRR80_005770 [Exophiala dermatitidis]|nr:ubiquitin thioesterase OTUB1, variant 2 [Exophiala dermatitidis NIH/UT8656]KAJ4536473.1 hypothetical protein HRR77_007390 [Exophiala dermatitidis]EHY56077.1 ubiquitin thioesterase OTUB1, variant 2 [Exophiala dermatitidis NIH/UT8656]KAJ4540999.1 hypothetical protein HRR76_004380 [Exophiala dermatitidis]KAJ4554780.1 hypothetical protein HRR79_009355 [Exophiala dermatitidis]KAJ4574302.1 hypothetical protein HRR82_006577 [Exophiala dermatitidis]
MTFGSYSYSRPLYSHYSPYPPRQLQYWRNSRRHPHYPPPYDHLPTPTNISFCHQSYFTPPATNQSTSTMATPDADEMERFQRLSDQYQAELPGPLIGEKKPLSELVKEYAQADPAYVAKTTALAVSHSSYRPIKGDGQCGWRGAVFGYFEILLNSRDVGLLDQELVRLQSFEQTMRAVGVDYDIMVDMFEYTWDLFAAIKAAIERGDKDDRVLLDVMNDSGQSDSIVYHFKMMTSSFMRVQSERYEAFLEMPVPQYCLTRIDPANQEIDHIGLQALTDAVIAPAYIALEVSYLDRSTGNEVTPHQFVLNSQNWPTIRLIYRPGHYDIIYKDDNKPLQVFVQTDAPQYVAPLGNELFKGDAEAVDLYMTMFPNMSSQIQADPQVDPQVGSASGAFGLQYQRPDLQLFTNPIATQQSYFPPVSQGVPLGQASLSTTGRSHSMSQAHQPPMTPSQPQLSPTAISPQSPSSNTPSSSTTGGATLPHRSSEPQIRYNEMCHIYNSERHESLPLDPGSFGS